MSTRASNLEAEESAVIKRKIAGTQTFGGWIGQEVVVSSVMPRSGSRFGYEMKAEYEGMELFSLTGSGTLIT